jgi:hypothetical protein
MSRCLFLVVRLNLMVDNVFDFKIQFIHLFVLFILLFFSRTLLHQLYYDNLSLGFMITPFCSVLVVYLITVCGFRNQNNKILLSGRAECWIIPGNVSFLPPSYCLARPSPWWDKEETKKLCKKRQYESGRALDRSNELATAKYISVVLNDSFRFSVISQHLVASVPL